MYAITRYALLMRSLCALALFLSACGPVVDEVRETVDFGANPGDLRLFEMAPPAPNAPLLMVLHGCSQNHTFADDGGFVALALEHGFALVAPEQRATNNPQGCFNWFNEEDTTRGSGELLSLRQMRDDVARRHDIDENRIFIVGVSAGAAIGSSLVAAYPERFAGAALMAGGPHGCAKSVVDSAACLAALVDKSPDEWADEVRRASDHEGPWPQISVWHGDADLVVNPKSSENLVAQWTALHEAREVTSETTFDIDLGTARVERFGDVVEHVRMSEVGHAFPVDPAAGCGRAVPFVEALGLCAAERVVERFGLDR